MKRFFVLTLLVLVGFGPALAQGTQDLDVVVIVKATNSQYWQYVFEGAGDAAEVLGLNLSTQGAAAESDIEEQISIVENAVSQQPDAIVVAPTAFEPLAAPIEDATAAGIPVVVIDSGVDTDAYASFLSTDNVEAGRRAGHELAACIEERTGAAEGQVAYLTALPGVGSLDARDAGFLEALEEYDGLEVVDQRYGDNDVAQALSNTLDLLTRYPDLVGIFADNNMMGGGAGAALSEQDAAEDVCLVAFDTDDQELAFLREGVIRALIVQDPYMMGYAGVMYGVSAHFGARLPREVDTGVFVVTGENIDSPEVQGLLDAEIRELEPYVGD